MNNLPIPGQYVSLKPFASLPGLDPFRPPHRPHLGQAAGPPGKARPALCRPIPRSPSSFPAAVRPGAQSGVRRSGWCRRRHRHYRSGGVAARDVSVDQVGADVGTRRPSRSLLALGLRTAVRAFEKSRLATGTFKWLQLPSFQGISMGSSIPWPPRHHLRARGRC